MKLPGFTAEASLYRTGDYYQVVGNRDQADNFINPAQLAAINLPFTSCGWLSLCCFWLGNGFCCTQYYLKGCGKIPLPF